MIQMLERLLAKIRANQAKTNAKLNETKLQTMTPN
jgi:hypothetical protein